ncbi:MAG TPA: hypothetical protein DIW47_06715 [Bacteroidetes bacterium]|nr:hypothetical protein [Bacteroidota bacterium]
MRAFLCLLLCLLSFGAVSGQSSLYRHYTVKDGLPGATVYGILQDSKGYMWFGSENGVTRFDGKTFITYTLRDGLTDNTVLNLYEDRKGRIWMLTLNGQLCYYLNNRFFNPSNDTLLARLPPSGYYSIPEEDRKGNLYFTSSSSVTFIITAESIVDKSENFAALVNQKKTDSFAVINAIGDYEHLLLSAYGHSFLKHQDSTRHFLHKQSIYEYGSSIAAIFNDNRLPTLKINRFLTIGEDFWVCSVNGAVQVAGFKTARPIMRTYLEGIRVNLVYRDREGNLWFSTEGDGLYLCSAHLRPGEHIIPGYENSSGNIRVLHLDNQGRIWAGGEKNQVFYIDIMGCRQVFLKGDISNVSAIYDIISDKKNAVYIVSNDRFIRIDPFTQYQQNLVVSSSNRQLLASVNLKSLCIGPEESIIAFNPFGFIIYEPGTALALQGFLKSKKPAGNQRIFTGHYTKNGIFWVANNNGLNRFSDDTLIPFGSDSIPLNEPISRMIEMMDGKLIIATRSKGLYLIEGNKIVQMFSVADGLASDICNRISMSGNKILVATARGVSLLSYDGKLHPVRNYTTKDGLLSNEVNDVISKNDTLYIASAEGLSVVAEISSERSEAPPIYITRILYGEENIGPFKTVLSYLNKYLQFHFVAITYQQPEAIEYRYRLSGTDNTWQINKSGIVDYPGLKPGNYTFEVQAKKYNSDWSKIERFSFSIQAPFWMESWFYAICMGVFLALAFVFISHLLRRDRLRKFRKLGVQNRMIQLEQQALSALMNPHFIFNALNSIQHYLHENDTLAANKYLSLFARLTRKNMEAVMKAEINLEDELERLELYLNFEKLRFGSKLNYQILIPDNLDMDEFMIPPMVLQPFIENAIWHGLMPKNEGGNIRVIIQKGVVSTYTIEIIDDGIGIEVSRELKQNKGLTHTSLGMQMTFERLELWAKQKGKSVQIEMEQLSDEKGNSLGTRVYLQLPFG